MLDPHSDFNPLDFFLWGYAKDNVSRNNPVPVPGLKNEIEVFMRTITADTCKSVVQNVAVRVRECLVRRGAHIEHAIHARQHP